MHGFFDDLLQAGTRIATSALDRPTYSTPPMFPTSDPYYRPPAYTATAPDMTNTLFLVAGVGVLVYFLMQPRRGRR